MILYDPSYGVTYSGSDLTAALADMESKAVAGYFISGTLAVNERSVGVDLDGDGYIDDRVVACVVFAFCRNDGGGHLVAAPDSGTPYGGTY